jgi:hypothetical protein
MILPLLVRVAAPRRLDRKKDKNRLILSYFNLYYSRLIG